MVQAHNPNVITREEAAQQLRQVEQNSILLNSITTTLAMQHAREFGGEILDIPDLITYATEAQLPLKTAYGEYVGERRATRTKEDHDAAIKKAREEGVDEGKRQMMAGPYPPPSQANAILANINQPVDATQHGVNAAVADWQKLTQQAGT